MIKIVIALVSVLPLILAISTPESSSLDRYCAASHRAEATKWLGEIFEDDTNLGFSSLVAKNLHHPVDTSAMAPDYTYFESKVQRTLNKKGVPLFKLKGSFLI
jgi:hypothetical protein